jgi:glycosyltransferase involved in cell wall biosynthesis
VLAPESILIAGIARDCAKTIRADVERLASAFDAAREIRWLIVESDSADDTPAILAAMQDTIPNFRAISLGRLRGDIPVRTERIAHCRNRYLDELQGDRYSDVDYVVVSDLDGMNRLLTRRGVRSSFARSDWDVCCANQRGPYYDILALRHPTWSPGDCLEQLRELRAQGVPEETALRIAIYSKMVRIPRDREWIEVDSAFGGLAIYRKPVLTGASYRGTDAAGASVCEHVALHAAIRARHGRIFINPALINSGYNRHSFDALPGSVLYRHALRLRRKLLDGAARLKAIGRS